MSETPLPAGKAMDILGSAEEIGWNADRIEEKLRGADALDEGSRVAIQQIRAWATSLETMAKTRSEGSV